MAASPGRLKCGVKIRPMGSTLGKNRRAKLWLMTAMGAEFGALSCSVKVRQRKRDIVESFRNGSQTRIEKTANLELIFGEASFSGPRTVAVRLQDGGQRTCSAKHIFINAGTRASRPDLRGLDTVPFLDNISIMELDVVPDHLLILGGGYIALEFGQLFRRFGSQVTIIQSGSQLLTREDRSE